MPLLGSRGAASLTGFGGLAKLGYLLRNSLRFRRSNSAYLSRTFGTPTNNKLFTWSGWVKRPEIGVWNDLFGVGGSNGFGFNTAWNDNGLAFFTNNISGDYFYLVTTQVFRDPSAWYHIVLAVDTTQATTSNRAKLYVNGVQITAFNTATYQSQGSSLTYNSATTHYLCSLDGSIRYFDGYLAEVNFVDGQALTPSSFAKTDAVTGQWIPIKFGGAYGTNGFYLNFNDTSAATAAAIGKDSSGNGNNWTPSGISVTSGTTYDSMTDVPTLGPTASNYCTFNPLSTVGGTFSNGNLAFNGGGSWRSTNGTLAFPTSGQWYFEATLTSAPYSPRASNTSYNWIGVGLATNFNSTSSPSDTNINGFLWGDNGFINNFTSSPVDSTVALSNGDVMRFGIDTTNNTYTLYKNAGLVASSTFNVTAGTQLVPYHSSYSTGYGAMAVNFGQQPFAYPTTSGAFSGYKALNTYNLP